MAGGVSIGDRDEDTAENARVKNHTVFLPELLEGTLGDG